MKKSSLVVALPTVVLAGLLLSGCGMFRSQKAWDRAQQEAPLEIPPGLDTPSASAALVIPPPGANAPTANGATAQVGGTVTDGFVLTDSVDNAYHRVGKTLEGGSLGQLTARDDTAHTYSLSGVPASATSAKKRGFFGRLFGRNKSSDAAPASGAGRVQISVNPSGTSGSEVRAQGDAAAVAKVIDTLKSQLGG
jgi:uncharacterized lipoprotein